ncbi:MAG TPA: hypothetical protein PKW23_03245 [Dictyoglomaceae bacterium]|nr:hypothetical protein [Dictyoglomaceae bacterium]HOP95446.1 hypothetical protein [Dictyoglomaceae bacterium]HPP15601.1 hypothetical protein [Dictyoglomaceae bacterium]HPU42917.1 hypothetical protein [Dictyoglomaceae bacterium]
MRRGQILIAVIFIFAILSLIMGGLIAFWEDSLRSVEAQKTEKQALYLAEGSAEIAVYSVIWLSSPASFTRSGSISDTNFLGKYTVSLIWYSPTFEIISTGEVEVVYTGEVYTYRRSLRLQGSRFGDTSPYTINITLWREE